MPVIAPRSLRLMFPSSFATRLGPEGGRPGAPTREATHSASGSGLSNAGTATPDRAAAAGFDRHAHRIVSSLAVARTSATVFLTQSARCFGHVSQPAGNFF